MKKIILLAVIAATITSCATATGPRTTYKERINVGDKFIFRRSNMAEYNKFTVDTVVVTDMMSRSVKLRNQKGVEHWTNSHYFRDYITPVNK